MPARAILAGFLNHNLSLYAKLTRSFIGCEIVGMRKTYDSSSHSVSVSVYHALVFFRGKPIAKI
jgi:hypothetical protein